MLASMVVCVMVFVMLCDVVYDEGGGGVGDGLCGGVSDGVSGKFVIR